MILQEEVYPHSRLLPGNFRLLPFYLQDLQVFFLSRRSFLSDKSQPVSDRMQHRIQSLPVPSFLQPAIYRPLKQKQCTDHPGLSVCPGLPSLHQSMKSCLWGTVLMVSEKKQFGTASLPLCKISPPAACRRLQLQPDIFHPAAFASQGRREPYQFLRFSYSDRSQPV